MLDMAKERMDEVKDLLDDKLSALEESWEVEDLSLIHIYRRSGSG